MPSTGPSQRRAYLGLGSNLGDRAANLQFGLDGLAALFLAYESDLPQVSSLEDFQPNIITEVYTADGKLLGDFAIERRVVVTFKDIPPHLRNAVVAVETALSPRELLGVAKGLEAEAGRPPPDPDRRWGPRPLDIDVLMVGDERVDEPDLVVPHPRIHQRAFVLAPLADVAPELVVAPSAGWQGVRRCALQLQLPQPSAPPE